MLRVRDLKVGYDLFELRADFSIQTGSFDGHCGTDF